MNVAPSKMLNHIQRLQGTIALLTLEGQNETTTEHSPRYALDVSGLSALELEWALVALQHLTPR